MLIGVVTSLFTHVFVHVHVCVHVHVHNTCMYWKLVSMEYSDALLLVHDCMIVLSYPCNKCLIHDVFEWQLLIVLCVLL